MGTWALGNSSGEQRREEIKALQKGIELGMKFIDTAEIYGHGRSETLVGDAIRDYRDDVFLATKVAPEHFGYDDVIKVMRGQPTEAGGQVRRPLPAALAEPADPDTGDHEGDGRAGRHREDKIHRGEQLLGRADDAGAGVAAQERAGLESGEVQHHVAFHRGRPAPLLREGEDNGDSLQPARHRGHPHQQDTEGHAREVRDDTRAADAELGDLPGPVVTIPKAGKVSHVEENASRSTSGSLRTDYQALSKMFE